jgi:hypothetical protein
MTEHGEATTVRARVIVDAPVERAFGRAETLLTPREPVIRAPVPLRQRLMPRSMARSSSPTGTSR